MRQNQIACRFSADRPVRRTSAGRAALADAGIGESGHAGVAGERGTAEQDRERSARGLAQAHVEVEQRPQAEPLEQAAVGRLGRPVRRLAVIERIRRQRLQTAAAAPATRPSSSTGMRRARAARIAPAMAAISRPPSRRSTSRGSASAARWCASARSITAALRAMPAASSPVPGPAQDAAVAAMQGGAQRRGRGGVADAHLAHRHQVEIRKRSHAAMQRIEAFGLAHRRRRRKSPRSGARGRAARP